MSNQLSRKENLHREKLLERIEGYFGVMNNLHKLSTDELIMIYCSVERLVDYEDQIIFHLKNTTIK